ncbi:MarR family winged helix-turn-helix transcriptional regulator [Deinococcus sp. UYEF24]
MSLPPDDHELTMLADAVQDLVWHLRQFGERAVGVTPLPYSELEVLRYIGAHPGRTVTEIARALDLQSSNVSVLLRHLGQRSLIVRQADEHDRRSTRLYVSEEAATVRTNINRVWTDALQTALGELSVQDAEALLRARPALQRLSRLTSLLNGAER